MYFTGEENWVQLLLLSCAITQVFEPLVSFVCAVIEGCQASDGFNKKFPTI